MKLAISLTPAQVTRTTGIGQVVLAQHKYLPQYGVTITDNDHADLNLCHIAKPAVWPTLDMVQIHGLYWADTPHLPFSNWHHKANTSIIDAAREAYRVIAPSNWVAMPFKRDMRIRPAVIPHGIDLAEWQPGDNQGYVLYNKNRESDVCLSEPVLKLAEKGFDVVSTFIPKDARPPIPNNLRLTGMLDFEDMKPLIRNAGIYLATTMETFGIGTLEAMAAGVPVLGFRWGGTEDIIEHLVTGYLVEPNDYQGLAEGARYIQKHRAAMGKAARQAVETRFTWEKVIGLYAQLFETVLQEKRQSSGKAAVVITNHNYGQWVGESIHSALSQIDPPAEVIVVDDGSTDNSRAVIESFRAQAQACQIEYKTIFQENQGVAAARNNGIRESQAEFCTFLDADDRLDKNFIKALRPALIKNRALGIAYSGLALLSPEGALGITSEWPPEFDWEVQSTPHVPPMNCIPSGCMFRKTMWERAGGVRQEYAPGEDTEFWTRGLSVGFKAQRVIRDPLFHYRGHDGSASRTRKYVSITDRMPWMITRDFPMGAPARKPPSVRSYVQPKVSVIIPVGPGHESFVPQALDSLIGQTFADWEVIVVNDTDFPLALPPAYPFARVIDNINGIHGAGAARNLGIQAARAPLVFFLDADDLLVGNALELLLDKFAAYNGDRYVYSDWLAVENGQTTAGHAKDFNRDEWRMYHPVSVLMTKVCAQGLLFDETLESWEDWDFFLRAAVSGVCGVRVPEPLLIYRLDSGRRRMRIISPDGKPNDLGEKVLAELNRRYGAFFTGEKTMSPCASCGGSSTAQEIIRAKGAINRMTDQNPQNPAEIPVPDANHPVRLEYTGDRVGATSYTVNGRTYRAGNNPYEKYIDVATEDAEALIGLGVFRRINQFVNQAIPAAPTPAPLPVAPVEKTAGELAAEANATLMKARAEFEQKQAEEDARLDEALKNMTQPIPPSVPTPKPPAKPPRPAKK